jgi:hypothetical protein
MINIVSWLEILSCSYDPYDDMKQMDGSEYDEEVGNVRIMIPGISKVKLWTIGGKNLSEPMNDA